MNIAQLKRRIVIHFTLYLLLFSSFLLLLIYIIISNGKVHRENQNTIKKIHSINLQIIETQKKEVMLNKNLNLWQKISSSGLRRNRYITHLNFELSQMYKKHSMLNPEISISVPEEVEMFHGSKHTRVVKNKVTLSFSTLSDKHIFSFLQSIPSLTGYVMIKSLVLNKEKNFDTITINKILNGEIIEMVRANIIFDWYIVLKNEN